jgi:hypothetical protein
MTVTLLFLALACTPEPPSVIGIEPATGAVGTTVTVRGTHFVEGSSARIGGQPLDGLKIDSESAIIGKIPAAVKPGPADLVVQTPGGTSAMPKGFTVTAVQDDAPSCERKERRMSNIASNTNLVKIDVYPEGEDTPTRLQYPTRDLERVELENTLMDGDGQCSAVFLVMKDGTRVLFDSDDGQDLRPQAQRIGNGLGRPVDVTVDDWPTKEEDPKSK